MIRKDANLLRYGLKGTSTLTLQPSRHMGKHTLAQTLTRRGRGLTSSTSNMPTFVQVCQLLCSKTGETEDFG
ncbi:hypothetical protein QQF64_030106 [Cirrhinus molitorella]|uniref:Uncharacterized protein n=1 Tax=Cirrhinus molitorella TaxID=172907 RepID=A0ABR3N2R9_9TELE